MDLVPKYIGQAPDKVNPSSKRLNAVSVHFFFCFLLCGRGMQIPCLRMGLTPDTEQFESQFRPIALIFLIDMRNPETCLFLAQHRYSVFPGAFNPVRSIVSTYIVRFS